MKKFLSLIVMICIIANTFCFFNVAAYEETKSEILDFFDAPMMDEEGYYYLNLHDPSYFIDYVNQIYLEEEIPSELNTFLNETYPNLVEEYNEVIHKTEEKYKKSGINAVDFKTYYTAVINFSFKAYNSFVPIYNKYLFDKENSETSQLLYYLGVQSSSFNYNNLGYVVHQKIYEDKHHLNEIYDKVYEELSKINDDEEEVKLETFNLMKTAVTDWIKEIDIDYIISYQKQVQLYLNSVKELGFVIDVETDDFVLKSENETRSPILSDLVYPIYIFSLNSDFHNMNLNSDGTEFLSPSDVYNSEQFQKYIEYVISPFASMPDYNKETVIEILKQTINGQYSALYAPGAYVQPATQGIGYMISSLGQKMQKGDKIPLLTDWIDPQTGYSPYDIYRALNYLKVPNIAMKSELSKKISRTIKYVFSDGSSAALDVTQTVEFTGTKNLISGDIKWLQDTLVFPAISNPSVTYPKNGFVVGLPANIVEEQIVNRDFEDIELTIIYPVDEKKSDDSNTKPDVPSTGSTFRFISIILLVIGLVGVLAFIKRRKNLNI